MKLTDLFRSVSPLTRLHPPGWTIFWTRAFGGPQESADRRMIFTTQELESFLHVARASPSGRVVIHHAGLEVSCMAPDSHPEQRVEVVRLIGSKIEPENVL